MPSLRTLQALIALSCPLFVALSAQAQGQSAAWQVADNFAQPNHYARTLSGSDFSSSVWLTNAASGGQMVWNGLGNNACLGNCSSPFISGSTLSWASQHPAGTRSAGGSFSAAPVTALDAAGQVVVTSQLHLWAELDAVHSSLFGDMAGAAFAADTQFDAGGAGPVPLYWKLEWRFEVSDGFSIDGEAPWVSVGVRLPGAFGPGDWFGPQPNGSGGLSGVLDADDYWLNNETLVTGLLGSVALRETQFAHGSGRADLWLSVSFSRAPIAAVPEPGTYALWALGLSAFGLSMRRRLV